MGDALAIMPTMKLLIIDDHSILREGVAEILRQANPGTLVLQARTIEEGIAMAAQQDDYGAILLDLTFPGTRSFTAIGALNEAAPGVPVVILSSSEDPRDVRLALARGARGYVPKSASAQTLVSALKLVMAGDIYLPSLLAAEDTMPSPVSGAGLTGRQRDVLQNMCRGLSNKDIGVALDMSEKTVKVHITAIFRTLNVVNRTQAVNAARLAGIVEI
jgi:DNA-binding NarL/FixJ family response regulator